MLSGPVRLPSTVVGGLPAGGGGDGFAVAVVPSWVVGCFVLLLHFLRRLLHFLGEISPPLLSSSLLFTCR